MADHEGDDNQPMTELSDIPLSEDGQAAAHNPLGSLGTNGLAFSGGGVRSAAFCSGVLRRLLQKNARVDYLSCVSGGGYTGTAYLDWKYRNEQRDDPAWHKEFFNHMRSRVGLLCNWQRPMQGVVDTLLMLGLMLMITVVLPFIVWFPLSMPIAYAVDIVFGDLLRFQAQCPTAVPKVNRTSSNRRPVRCRPNAPLRGTLGYNRMLLFSITVALFIIFYILAKYHRRASATAAGYLHLLSSMAGFIFAMTFIPWFINDFLSRAPLFVQFATILLSILIWYFFPVLRQKASLVIIIYCYGYIVYWRVFKRDVLGLNYERDRFNILLFACGLVMAVSPVLGMIHQRVVFAYNRWRLQWAFYHPSGLGRCGCRGIGWFDLFLGSCNWQCCKNGFQDANKPLTMRDIADVSPHYISNIVVNEWIRRPGDASYGMMTVSPTEVERIESTHPSEFAGKLEPDHIHMSEAMATSAAAVARHMGMYDRGGEGFKHIQTLLGIGMGSSKPTDMSRLQKENQCIRLLPLFIGILQSIPLIAFPVIWLAGGDEKWIVIGVFTYLGCLLLIAILAVLKTGSENPGLLEKIVRWCLVHLPNARFIRDLMRIRNQGPMPPAILRLSDGGHLENLALMPLLKRRLKKIVVVNGGHTEDDDSYADEMIYSLELARKNLYCSFIGQTGRDVIEDIRELFSRKEQGNQPRSYSFRVDYYHKESKFAEGVKVGEGEVVLLAPRHPSNGVKTTSKMTWDEVGQDLESGLWGTGPELDAEEVDHLTWCCCAGCHGKLQGVSEALLDKFPQHSTANQFFTPPMFSAYHREGYRACVEGKAAEFLSELQPIIAQPII